MSIFSKIKQALSKTSNKITNGIDNIFVKQKLDDETLLELEELLISADITSSVAKKITMELKSTKFDKNVSPDIIKEKLAELVSRILTIDMPIFLKEGFNIILVCGVNGNGKTTTIGKLANLYTKQGKKVAVAACDTFRAAAVEQLETWANRAGALLITGPEKADPASVAFNSIMQSISVGIDVLFIDTAGRLHNHKNLMEELSKIIRVIKKIDPSAPHQTILVLDATTGQNAYNQIEQFIESAAITGLIITKLEGTAKAGVIVGITEKFALPIGFVGVGEGIEDLKTFDPKEFANGLVGL